MIIVDNHAHIFPYLGGNSEYALKGLQMFYAQKLISDHHEPTRKIDTYEIVNNETLWNKIKPGPEGRYEVNFKAGNFGKYEWTKDGINYCKQYMPVSLQNMVAPPELLIAQMNFAGISKAVLQHSHIYGKLNIYYYNAIKKYPNRFIGLFQIDEALAYTEDQIIEAEYCVNKLNLKGVYFEFGGLFMGGYKNKASDKIYNTFWSIIEKLTIPIYFGMESRNYIEQIHEIYKILEKYPNLIVIITLGLPFQFAFQGDEIIIPEVIKELLLHYQVYLEIAYPISIGREYEYPYRRSQILIGNLYNFFGPSRLIWGSDIPNVERYCTYKQSLSYLNNYCSFLSLEDKELILGKNVLKLFEASM